MSALLRRRRRHPHRLPGGGRPGRPARPAARRPRRRPRGLGRRRAAARRRSACCAATTAAPAPRTRRPGPTRWPASRTTGPPCSPPATRRRRTSSARRWAAPSRSSSRCATRRASARWCSCCTCAAPGPWSGRLLALWQRLAEQGAGGLRARGARRLPARLRAGVDGTATRRRSTLGDAGAAAAPPTWRSSPRMRASTPATGSARSACPSLVRARTGRRRAAAGAGRGARGRDPRCGAPGARVRATPRRSRRRRPTPPRSRTPCGGGTPGVGTGGRSPCAPPTREEGTMGPEGQGGDWLEARLSRRRVIRGALAGGGLLAAGGVLAACGDSGRRHDLERGHARRRQRRARRRPRRPPQPTSAATTAAGETSAAATTAAETAPATTAAAAGPGVKGGTIRYSSESPPSGFDPAKWWNQLSWDGSMLVNEPLIELKQDGVDRAPPARRPARGERRRHALHVQAARRRHVLPRHAADGRRRQVLARAAAQPGDRRPRARASTRACRSRACRTCSTRRPTRSRASRSVDPTTLTIDARAAALRASSTCSACRSRRSSRTTSRRRPATSSTSRRSAPARTSSRTSTSPRAITLGAQPGVLGGRPARLGRHDRVGDRRRARPRGPADPARRARPDVGARARPSSSRSCRATPTAKDLLEIGVANNVHYFTLSLKHPELQNLKVRQAIAHAVDKERFVRAVKGSARSPTAASSRRAARTTRTASATRTTPSRPRRCSPRPGFADGFSVTFWSAQLGALQGDGADGQAGPGGGRHQGRRRRC